MCHTEAPQQMTMNTGAPAGASSLPDPTASDPLSSAITAMEASQPKTTSPLAPTKFGKLLKVLEPALEGGTIGAFAGRSHPGGGFGAAQDFYDTKRRHELQLAAFQNTLENSRQLRALEAARTAHEVNQPYFTRGGTTAAQDEEGNDVLLEQNPFTGVREPVPGYRPPAKPDKAPHFQMTDKGLVSIGPDGKASQVTLPETSAAPPQGPPASTGIVQAGGQVSPMFVARKPGSGTVAAKPSSGAPLRAPGFSTPKVAKVANRNASGTETDNLIDENPDSATFGQPLKTDVASRAPLPDKAANREVEASNKRRAHFTDQLNREFADSERQRSKAIAALAKDQELTPKEKTARRAEIEEENADRKQTLHQRISDLAAGEGIDIGGPGDYHAQSSGGQAVVKSATAAPGTAPGNKVTAGPKVGETRNYQGVPFKFDGKKWVRAKAKAG